jgi:CBS domain-containing protein
LAALLSERGISGVPVVDADNRVVGIVSEGDLLHRVETATERQPKGRAARRRSWLEGIASDRELAREERLTFRVAAENISGVRRVEEPIVAPPTPGAAPGDGGEPT